MLNAAKRIKYMLSGEGKEMIPNFIILHHSKTKDGITVSWPAIRRYHLHTMGWNDIGYHYGIELVGGHDGYELMIGRMPDETGAHCRHKGMNRKSIGVCLVGDFDEKRPPERQWREGLRLCKYLMGNYNIDESNIYGHREIAEDHRTCPGSMFDLDEFRAAVSHS